jgi:hypothetical protein
MQPEWRSGSDGMLIRETPPDENWLALKKGGSAGIFFVIVSLSWWVMAQSKEADHRLDAWAAVADILWWFREMRSMALSPSGRAKWAHEDEEEESHGRKK